ncbi:hypothetical protein OH76DRAFT_1488928 [Lentinus brumalis]|uniref:Uncharacterized protein n=1 Tax=Lentinus brumalis TaxID=2498619 RepID=A0A371CPD5_9APHY|nr:hypothetical protein OH76DRAFT_1488928 [Polyporus brumalis]
MAPAPSQAPASVDGLSLHKLEFNPIDVARLRTFLGDGDVYKRYQHRFDLADLAWFIAGAHQDGSHSVKNGRFHSQWFIGRMVHGNDKETAYQARREFRDRLKELVWDAITMLDRIDGGASFLVHTSGTVEPRYRVELPSLKLDVYVTPWVLVEEPMIDRRFADMIQQFAQNVALPATRRWYDALALAKMPLERRPDTDAEPPSHRPFLSRPSNRTTMFTCYGRREGELEEMLMNAADDVGPRDRDGPGRREGYPNARAEAEALRSEVERLQSLVDEKDAEIQRLQGELEDAVRHYTPAPLFVPRPVHGSRLTNPTPAPSRASARTASQGPGDDRASSPGPRNRAVARENPISPPSRMATPPATALPSPQKQARSPVSSRSSQLVSAMSDWSFTGSVPCSPSAMGQGPWIMPSASQSDQRAAASTSMRSVLIAPSQPVLSSPAAKTLTRFTIVGPKTHDVLVAAALPSSLHRDLRELVASQPDSVWFDILCNKFELHEDVAAKLFDALCDDVPAL